MRLLDATTKRWSRLKKSARWKKLPRKVNVNCSAGKPAGPTVTPGGSEALGFLAAEEPLLEVAVVEALLLLLSCRLRKSTPAAPAALWIWEISEGTLSSARTASPSF